MQLQDCCTLKQTGRQYLRAPNTSKQAAIIEEQLPLNGGSGCWIYHAVNMTSFAMKSTSPLIASASLTQAFNQTL